MKPLMLNADGAARYLGISYQTFNDWRRDAHEPKLPEPVVLRARKLWLVSELHAFVEKCVRTRDEAIQAKKQLKSAKADVEKKDAALTAVRAKAQELARAGSEVASLAKV